MSERMPRIMSALVHGVRIPETADKPESCPFVPPPFRNAHGDYRFGQRGREVKLPPDSPNTECFACSLPKRDHAAYADGLTHMGVPISRADDRRISRDGP